MPTDLIILSVFLCDDVRFERSGKFIFVGAYNSLIMVNSFPAALRFHLVLLSKIPSPGQYTAKIRMADDGDTKGIEFTVDANAKFAADTEFHPIGPIMISAKAPGDFWLEREVAGQWERLATWELKAVPAPQTQPAPTS